MDLSEKVRAVCKNCNILKTIAKAYIIVCMCVLLVLMLLSVWMCAFVCLRSDPIARSLVLFFFLFFRFPILPLIIEMPIPANSALSNNERLPNRCNCAVDTGLIIRYRVCGRGVVVYQVKLPAGGMRKSPVGANRARKPNTNKNALGGEQKTFQRHASLVIQKSRFKSV